MRLTARADEVSAYVVVLGRPMMTETSKQTASGRGVVSTHGASHIFWIWLGARCSLGGMKRLKMMRLMGLLTKVCREGFLLATTFYFEELELHE
mmetsp:Transcript_10774/g.16641  ORF Transcript_10774/g.16641 Transcript_10774/m.16641 type:complete len:94 (+) Transcript_10774:1060-1341(+)